MHVTDNGDQPTEYRQHRFAPPPGATDILLIRHGESAPVKDGVPPPSVDGQDDPPLDPVGVRQAELLAERLADEQIDAIYVTTLQRTQQTAAPLAAKLGLTPTVVKDLREIFLGDWEGGSFRKNFAEQHPIALQVIEQQRWDVIPGAESFDQFGSRLRGALSDIVSRHPDQRVAVVVHGGVIGELLRQAVSGTEYFAFVGCDNASISQLVVTDERWIVRRFNDTAHLGGMDLDPGPSMPQDAPDPELG